MVIAIGENLRDKAFRFGIYRAENLGSWGAVFSLFERGKSAVSVAPAEKPSV
jgi:hypothetical protein